MSNGNDNGEQNMSVECSNSINIWQTFSFNRIWLIWLSRTQMRDISVHRTVDYCVGGSKSEDAKDEYSLFSMALLTWLLPEVNDGVANIVRAFHLSSLSDICHVLGKLSEKWRRSTIDNIHRQWNKQQLMSRIRRQICSSTFLLTSMKFLRKISSWLKNEIVCPLVRSDVAC